MAKKKKKEENSVHVRIETPLALRKEILTTAIDATRLLQKYQEYHSLTIEKNKKFVKLNKVLKSIKSTEKKLNSKELPKLPEEKKPVVMEEKLVEVPIVSHEKPKAEMNPELARLTQELKDIESKLKHL